MWVEFVKNVDFLKQYKNLKIIIEIYKTITIETKKFMGTSE